MLFTLFLILIFWDGTVLSAQPVKKLRVCVIGAGPAGLSAARHLAVHQDKFEFTVYERSNEIGGIWLYNEKTGLDDDGYPVHSSMYRDLRANVPMVLMGFPDYRRNKESDGACLTHRAVLDYLIEYANQFDLYRFIQFHTVVERVEFEPLSGNYNSTKGKWKVKTRDTKSGQMKVFFYDAIMVCNGHFFEPNIPQIPGLDKFEGDVLHSHDYRMPEFLYGKRAIVLGAAVSGVDIALEISKAAELVYLSHNYPRKLNGRSSNIVEIAGIDSFRDGVFILKDGSNVTGVDALIFCTGYRYSYPFLSESTSVRVIDNQVMPLYKHVINVEHPSMGFIGIPQSIIPMPLFHLQVQYFVSLLMCKFSLPSKAEMLSASKILPTLAERKHAHDLKQTRWFYNDQLAKDGKFEPLQPYYRIGYEMWEKLRQDRITDYKNFLLRVESDNKTVHIEHRPQLLT
ncbi:hypothetical protein QAD02_005893 [Eretmocerus hayati]|uniref:Uncharacterized protein n=1 Tax=Eretmocerus hayati TaxID=131215 RepID=A0ACC2N073_9HYME|nr:hypothetical protein QAD02_005893 [Eretmocerus hayati]